MAGEIRALRRRAVEWLIDRQERYVKKCEVDLAEAEDRVGKFQRYKQLGGLKYGPKRLYELEQEVKRCKERLDRARSGLEKMLVSKASSRM